MSTPAAGRSHSERGAIILLALAFLTVIGALAVSLLSFAYAGSSALTSYRVERTRRYTADSALQTAVQRVKTETTLGISSTAASPEICARYDIPQDISEGNITDVVGTDAFVTVECYATPGVPADFFDLDGGQAPRDVTFRVLCRAPGSIVVDRQLVCGASGDAVEIGTARVRFENDYSLVPITERAVVPKVVSWSINT